MSADDAFAAIGPAFRDFAGETWLMAGLAAIIAFLVWGRFRDVQLQRRLAEEGPGIRESVYRDIHLFMWPLAVVCFACWLLSGRSPEALGLTVQTGAGWLAAWAFVAISTVYLAWSVIQVLISAKARRAFLKQMEEGGDVSLVAPETPRQHRRFYAVAFTAGITEEIVFRGFLFGVFALIMPLPAAAAAGTALFIAAHAYQGVKGMMRIAPISIILATVFIVSGSLLPAMALHFLVDAAGGAILYVSHRGAGGPEARQFAV